MSPDAAKSATPAGQPADSCVMVIFGASGDLAQRKLIPALYNLARDKLLSQHFAVVGFATRDYTTETFRAHLDETMEANEAGAAKSEAWTWLRQRIYYVSGSLQDAAAYPRLEAQIKEAAKAHDCEDNHFYYLAVAPQFIGEIVQKLGEAGLARETGGHWRRVNIEKPFGRDLESARALNVEIRKTLEERQIYRIDHYLGKETVQNLMVFRFGNSIFEPIWNRSYIDHVQITAAETLGVEMRGGYYETSGTLRDMVPNHLFQLVSLTAMEPPISFAADAVRDEQTKVLDAIQIPRAGRGADPDRARAIRRGRVERDSGCPPIARSPTWHPNRIPKPSSRSNSGSTTGAGPMCRSTCARASAWPGASPKS